jgi:hypothetical protein
LLLQVAAAAAAREQVRVDCVQLLLQQAVVEH